MWNNTHPLKEKNPFKWTTKKVNENIEYHRNSLTSSLYEHELSEAEYDIYMGNGGSVDKLGRFKKIIRDSKSEEEAYGKISQLHDVPSETADYFYEKYGESGEISQREAFHKLYNEVKKPSSKKAKKATGKKAKSVGKRRSAISGKVY